jgi:hypothetical protein
VQILLEKGEDRDIQGNDLPGLIYVSREKRPGIPHHYKAGALNVLVIFFILYCSNYQVSSRLISLEIQFS